MEGPNGFSHLLAEQTVNKALEVVKHDSEFAVPGCHYEIARGEREAQVVDFVRDQFFTDEPLFSSISHINPWTDVYRDLWMHMVKDGVSLVLVSDSTDEIVAIRVNSIGKKGVNFYPVDPSTMPEGMRKISGILQALRAKCDVYEHYNVTERMNFVALGVHRDHRRKGVGQKIMNAAIALVKNFGSRPILVKGEASSNYSKKIYENCDFDELGEILYKDYKEDGEIVFKTQEHQQSVKYYAKLIR